MEHLETSETPDQMLMITQARIGMADHTAEEISLLVESGNMDRALGELVWYQSLAQEIDAGISQGAQMAQEMAEQAGQNLEQRLQEIIEQAHGSGEKVTQAIRKLDNLNVTPLAENRDQIAWVARRCQEICRGQEFQKHLQRYLEIEARKSRWDDESRLNHLRTLQQLAVSPDQLIWDVHDNNSQQTPHMDTDIEGEAQRSRESTRDGMTQALQKYNEQTPSRREPNHPDVPGPSPGTGPHTDTRRRLHLRIRIRGDPGRRPPHKGVPAKIRSRHPGKENPPGRRARHHLHRDHSLDGLSCTKEEGS